LQVSDDRDGFFIVAGSTADCRHARGVFLRFPMRKIQTRNIHPRADEAID
jgi:hypothetical protein